MTDQDIQDLRELLTSLLEAVDARLSEMDRKIQIMQSQITTLEQQQHGYIPAPTYPGIQPIWITGDNGWTTSTVSHIFGTDQID